MSKNKLASKLLKNTTIKNTALFSEDEFKDWTYVPTPIYLLNLALSGKFDGGITGGCTVVSGESRTFKTMLGLIMLRSYLDNNEEAVGLIYDNEFSIRQNYLKSLGLDKYEDRIVHSYFENIEQLKIDIVNQMKDIEKGDKVFILIDSLGASASLKEIEDAENGKIVADMQRAKGIKSFFRIITPMVNIRDIPLITINHVYKTMELYGKTIISGGSGVLLSANQAIVMTKRNSKEEDNATDFVMNIYKSRFIKEGIRLPLVIESSGSLKKYSGLFDLSLETGFLLKDGMKYFCQELPNYEKQWKKDIINNKEFWEDVLNNTNFQKVIENALSVSTNQTELFNDKNIEEIRTNIKEEEK